MRKGVIFSMDAVLALIIVIMLAGWTAQQTATSEERINLFEELQRNALDNAIVAFYGGSAGDESISSIAHYGKCVVIYDLDPNNDLSGPSAFAEPDGTKICEER